MGEHGGFTHPSEGMRAVAVKLPWVALWGESDCRDELSMFVKSCGLPDGRCHYRPVWIKDHDPSSWCLT
jgi:hypothetical protein